MLNETNISSSILSTLIGVQHFLQMHRHYGKLNQKLRAFFFIWNEYFYLLNSSIIPSHPRDELKPEDEELFLLDIGTNRLLNTQVQ